MVMIHPISETIPPRPDVVQTKIDSDPVSSFPEHLSLEVAQYEFVPPLVIPQISVAIESHIYHIVNHLKYTLGLTMKYFHLV